MSESFTETEISDSPGCFEQLKNAIAGVAIGGLMVVVAIPALFYNEWSSASRYEDLADGKGSVVSVKADKVDKSHEGDLVHVSGKVKYGDPLVDSEFGVEATGLRLVRDVEMYQWEEVKKTKKKKKGKKEVKETTYTYKQTWSDKLIDSSDFNAKYAKGKTNPAEIPYKEEVFSAKDAKLGAYDISKDVSAKLSSSKPHKVKAVADKIKSKFKLESGKLYMGKDAANPEIGDVRIEYALVAPDEISVIGKQVGNTFVPKKMSNGELLEVAVGKVTAEKMFADAEASNAMMTWMLRIGGFVFMFIGFMMFFKPFTVIADKIPLVGGLLESGIAIFAGMLAFGISFVTIAAGWIISRPLVGVPLCIVGLGALGGMVFLAMKAKKSKEAAA